MTVRWRRPALNALALVALGALSFGCSKASRPHLERVEISAFEGKDVVGTGEADLKDQLVRLLDGARFVVMKPGDKAPEGATIWRASLAAEAAEPDPEQGAIVHVGVVLTLRQRGAEEGFDVEVREKQTSKSNSVDDLQAAAREAMEKALHRACVEGRATIDLEKLKDDEVVAKLKDKSEGVREAAIRALARRHNKAVLPTLLERLKTDDVDEIRRITGLLVELRDPGAVPALIEASHAKNVIVQREIVFALGAIGGEEAEAYLYVVAQGHDDPLVRASAEQALEELKSRASAHPKPGENKK